MAFKIPHAMAEATRLVTDGKLAEATALIQTMLHSPRAATPVRPDVIDATTVALPALGEVSLVHKPPVPATSQAAAPKTLTNSQTVARPRASIGESLRGLAARVKPTAFDMPAIGTPRPAPAPLPAGATFETASYTNAAGTRAYKLYVPSRRTGHRSPLLVMLHGCTQSPDDFAAGTRMNAAAEAHGYFVAYPAQPASANPHKCWNWFQPADQHRDRGEPSLIAGLTQQIVRDHGIDPDRVFIAGLSAGGAMAALMGAEYPDVFAAVGVHSGLPAGAAHDLPSALAAMRQGPSSRSHGGRAAPTIIFHGDQDKTVHASNGTAIAARALASSTGQQIKVQRGRADGGHSYSCSVLSDASGLSHCEHWTIHGAGHAWAGGSAAGSFTDPKGPDATSEMLRFFRQHQRVTELA